MGALPKRRISTARKGKRRAAKRLKMPTLVACPHCGQFKKSHQVCPNCHGYRKPATEGKTTKESKSSKK